MARSYQVSTLTAAPMLVAILIGLFLYVVTRDSQLALDNARDEVNRGHLSQSHQRSVEKQLSSILVSVDLVVGAEQWMLVGSVGAQIAALQEYLNSDALKSEWCCAQETLKWIDKDLNALEALLTRGSDIKSSGASPELFAELDQRANSMLEAHALMLEAVEGFESAAAMAFRDAQRRTNFLNALSLPVGLLVVALVWFTISRTISKPIVKLAWMARRAMAGEHFTGDYGGPAELQDLSEAFTRLSGHLEEQLEDAREQVRREALSSEQKLTHYAQQLESSVDQLAMILHAADAATFEWNLGTDRVLVDFPGAQAKGLNLNFEQFLQRVHAEQLESFKAALFDSASRKTALEAEVRFLLSSGDYRWMRVTGKLIAGVEGAEDRKLVGSMIDFNERVEQQEKIWELAHTDTLTQTANRAHFNRRFDELLKLSSRPGHSFDLLLVDLNDFKLLNDTQGHLVGDAALIEVGKLLREQAMFRGLAARLGGDEFALLMHPGLQGDIEKFCKILMERCDRLDIGDRAGGGVKVSIGVARYPIHGSSVNELMQSADTALYVAKKEKLAGSAYRVFHSAMNDSRRHRTRIRAAIKSAIADNEFSLAFQPLVDGERRVQSAEALLRCHALSAYSVPEIISVAEESGQIIELFDVILNKAFETLALLMRNGFGQQIAINISPLQFRHQDVVSKIGDYADLHGVPVDRLKVEITEGTFLEDVERAVRTIKQLKALGIDVSIDDFGTGYSSLGYLQKLSVDWIKIDRIFVTDIDTDDAKAQLVRAIVSMAGAMAIRTVAEGAETEAEFATLQELGVDRVQGYLICKPLPQEQFLSFLVQDRHDRHRGPKPVSVNGVS